MLRLPLGLSVRLIALVGIAVGLATGSATADSDDYQLDDGVLFGSLNSNTNTDVVLLNQFIVLPGKEVITAVSISWGPVSDGLPVTIIVWDDPNNDGDPADAVPIASAPGSIEAGEFVKYPVGPVDVGDPGESFFVGFHATAGAVQIRVILNFGDGTRSWQVISGGVCDPANLAACNGPHRGIDLVPMIRANATGRPPTVPSVSEWGLTVTALLLFAGITLFVVRCRKPAPA